MKLKINNAVIAINKEGIPFIFLFFLIGIISLSVYGLNFFTFLLLSLGFFMVFFFREPQRVINAGENNILSPADGKIETIEEVLLDEIFDRQEDGLLNKKFYKISISIGILDSHIQKSPVNAKVVDIKYEEGKFLNTSLNKDHKDNEKNHIFFKNQNDHIIISQISGILSRRISCFVKINEDISQGQNCGIIKFGSMVNIYIPSYCKINIKVGQTMIAGETIIAYFK